jgi:DNA polymerase III subunit delta
VANSAQAETKPVVVVLHGNDPLLIRRAVDTLVKESSADPAIADMNITRLDGRQAAEQELRTAVLAMPFLAERRLVIVTNPLAKANTDAGRKRYQALLDGLPDFTTLVLVMEDTLERGRWKSLHDHHWLRRWLEKAGKRGQLQLCALPEMGRMPDWIRKEAVNQGGQFHMEAAKALVAHVGNDTQLATQEIIKLLTYVDFKRAVDMDDVDLLTSQGGQADVFDMVDAMAVGNARGALTLLHRLLEEQEPLTLFGMIVRQFRLLVQARELIDERRGGEIAGELRLHPFVAEKLTQQARRFGMTHLEMIYHHLLEMDEMMKTSQMPSDLVLDTFIADLQK